MTGGPATPDATTVPAVKMVKTPPPAPAVELPLYEALSYTDKDGNTIQYRLLKPEKYDASVKYPVVLFLHGGGEGGNDNAKQITNQAQALARPALRAKYPCFEIVPQCPPGSRGWGRSAAPSTRPSTRPAVAATVNGQQLALEVLDKVCKQYSIDVNRMYITGLSMGGYGTWDVITHFPTKFAAAAPVCGGGDPANVKGIVDAKLPLWVWHGAADPTVPVKNSRDMVKALRDAGLEVKFTETPGQGHNEWDVTYTTDEFWAWLFAQKKSS
jgi:predicted peptidase